MLVKPLSILTMLWLQWLPGGGGAVVAVAGRRPAGGREVHGTGIIDISQV